MHGSDHERYVAFATVWLEDAGRLTLQRFLAGPTRMWKEDQTPVTAADIEINRLVIERISSAFPYDGVRGERKAPTSAPS